MPWTETTRRHYPSLLNWAWSRSASALFDVAPPPSDQLILLCLVAQKW